MEITKDNIARDNLNPLTRKAVANLERCSMALTVNGLDDEASVAEYKRSAKWASKMGLTNDEIYLISSISSASVITVASTIYEAHYGLDMSKWGKLNIGIPTIQA